MPALIVLDMLMPVMNGWQFAREFRARYGVEGPDRGRHRGRARAQPRRGDRRRRVLPKPFEVSDLLRLVARTFRDGPGQRAVAP
jgi:CheY-like chemotaxis protein